MIVYWLNLLAFRLLLFQEIDYRSVTQTVIQEIVTDKYQKNNTLTVFYWDIVQSQVQYSDYDTVQ